MRFLKNLLSILNLQMHFYFSFWIVIFDEFELVLILFTGSYFLFWFPWIFNYWDFWWTFMTWTISVSIYVFVLHQFNGLTYCLYSTGFWSWLISLLSGSWAPYSCLVIKSLLICNLLVLYLPYFLLSPDFYFISFSLSSITLIIHYFWLLYFWTHFYYEKGGSTQKIYLHIFWILTVLITFSGFFHPFGCKSSNEITSLTLLPCRDVKYGENCD